MRGSYCSGLTLIFCVLTAAQVGPPTQTSSNGKTSIQIGPKKFEFKLEGPPIVSIEATLRSLKLHTFVVQTPDHRIVWFRIGRNLHVDDKAFRVGDHVAVAYQPDIHGENYAVLLEPFGEGTQQERADALRTWDLPVPLLALGGEDRPPLTRGGAPAPAPAPETPPSMHTPLPPLAPTSDPVLQKAGLAGHALLEDLPNFSAQRKISRFEQTGRKIKSKDVIRANLILNEGIEKYSNIRINNQSLPVSLDQLPGLRSTGEFGELAARLFEVETRTVFQMLGESTMNRHPCWKYTFEVPREGSRWRLFASSELYYPAYGGTVWIDQETSHVVRLEMQARNIPYAFPYNLAELTIDYGYIRLDQNTSFFLPTQAEALSCPHTGPCLRNTSAYQGYARYGAKSTVRYDEIQ